VVLTGRGGRGGFAARLAKYLESLFSESKKEESKKKETAHLRGILRKEKKGKERCPNRSEERREKSHTQLEKRRKKIRIEN